MKIAYIVLALLCMMTLAWAATGTPSAEPASKQATQQSGQTAEAQVTTPAPVQSGHNAAVLSRTEADSLRVQGDRQLAESGVGEVNVGAIGGNDIIYILVVVLLVVVIIAVIR
jgi:hypothetical protein